MKVEFNEDDIVYGMASTPLPRINDYGMCAVSCVGCEIDEYVVRGSLRGDSVKEIITFAIAEERSYVGILKPRRWVDGKMFLYPQPPHHQHIIELKRGWRQHKIFLRKTTTPISTSLDVLTIRLTKTQESIQNKEKMIIKTLLSYMMTKILCSLYALYTEQGFK